MARRLSSIFGGFLPNQRLVEYQEEGLSGKLKGMTPLLGRVDAGQMNWVLALEENITPEQAWIFKGQGFNVILRMSRTGVEVHWEDILKVLTAFGSSLFAIQFGPEPGVGDEDKHLWYLNEALKHGIINACHFYKVLLLAPGWQKDVNPEQWSPELRGGIVMAYNQLDGVAVHMYDIFTLLSKDSLAHLKSWMKLFPGHNIYITEFGIARRYFTKRGSRPQWREDLDKIYLYLKAMKYIGKFTQVVCMIMFILGGTTYWRAFKGEDEDFENGDSRYWIALPALAVLGDELKTAQVEVFTDAEAKSELYPV